MLPTQREKQNSHCLRRAEVSAFVESNSEGLVSWDRKNDIPFPKFEDGIWNLLHVIMLAVEKA